MLGAMPDPTAALYVRLPHTEFDKLDRAADALATNKKAIVTTLVSRYVDPDSDAGLDHLRTIAGAPLGDRKVTIELPDKGVVVGHHAFTPAPMPQAPAEVLTAPQAAALLQVEEAELVALAESGELPGRRIGTQWRFSRAAVIAWLAGA